MAYPGDIVRGLVEELETVGNASENLALRSKLQQIGQKLLALKLPRDPVKVREETWLQGFPAIREYLRQSAARPNFQGAGPHEVSYVTANEIHKSIRTYPRGSMGGYLYYLQDFHPDSEIAEIIREVEALVPGYRVQYHDDTVYAYYISIVRS